VSDVAEEGPADAAGIEPGDVLRGIGEVAIDSVDAAQRAIAGLLPGAQTEIQLVRGSAPRTLTVQVGSAFGMAGRLRRADGAPESLTVDAVYSPAQLRDAAVPPGARLLTVNGRPVASRVQALRESRRRPAVTVLRVQHQGQRFFGAFAGSR
jgi:S1-C subfamily serine protease